MATDVVLRDGTPAMIWRVLPSDRATIRENYLLLSPATKFNRFLAGVRTLSDDMLRVLVDDVDGVDHVALHLVALPSDGEAQLIGVGRLVRYPDDPQAADLGITIFDEWQGRGGASALMDELVRLLPEGITEIVTSVRSENAASMALLARTGTIEETSSSGGISEVRVRLRTLRCPSSDQQTCAPLQAH